MKIGNRKIGPGNTLIAKELGLYFYFATPYHGWERGSIENLNGLIRQYIPKGTHINAHPDEYITFLENVLNNRPRKRFGYLSPNQVFHNITTMRVLRLQVECSIEKTAS